MCVPKCGYVRMSAGAHGIQRFWILELKLQAVVSHVTWVLRNKFMSFAKALCTLNP